MKTKILFLGSGYTCVWAYKYLKKNLNKKAFQGLDIQVISASDHHAFHGFTGEFLGGVLPLELRCTPNQLLFAEAKITKGYVESIDQLKQIVRYFNPVTESVEFVNYDHLVIGMGAKDAKKLPGGHNFTYSVKEHEGIQDIRNKIHELLENAAFDLNQKPISITICGAGLAGVEICANLAEYMCKLEPMYPCLEDKNYVINLVHGGERILPQLLPKFEGLVQYSEKKLAEYNVVVHNNRRVKSFDGGAVYFENGNVQASDITIDTLGQQVCAPNANLEFYKDNQSRLLGTKYLNAKGFDNIWIGGDVANIPHISGKEPCRADALWAVKHGTRIGRNIARSLQDIRLLPFTFYGLGQAASFGQNKAFSELYGIQITGALAWWIRFGFFLYFMPKRAQAYKTINAYFNRNKNILYKNIEVPQPENNLVYLATTN